MEDTTPCLLVAGDGGRCACWLIDAVGEGNGGPSLAATCESS